MYAFVCVWCPYAWTHAEFDKEDSARCVSHLEAWALKLVVLASSFIGIDEGHERGEA